MRVRDHSAILKHTAVTVGRVQMARVTGKRRAGLQKKKRKGTEGRRQGKEGQRDGGREGGKVNDAAHWLFKSAKVRNIRS